MEGANSWSREEEKAFENAIAMHWIEEISEEQWKKIASMVPSKDMEQLKKHFEILVEDVNAIESGQIPIPCYSGGKPIIASLSSRDFSGLAGSGLTRERHGGKGGSRSEQERKKGIPWSEEEHRLFLVGLDKFGKGDWRSISRNFVVSRNPTQVASHAQKYFIRLNSLNRERRRSSIHDITSLNNQTPPVTGQQQQQGVNTMGQPATKNHRPVQGIGIYGVAQLGHPLAAASPGHIGGSAVGTPVMLPHHHHHHHHPPPYVVPVTAYPMPPPPPPAMH